MTKKISIFFAVLLLSTSVIFAKTIVTVNGHKIDDSIIPKGYEQLTDDQKAKLTEQLIKEELIHQYLLKSDIVRDKEFKKIFQQQKEMVKESTKKLLGKI